MTDINKNELEYFKTGENGIKELYNNIYSNTENNSEYNNVLKLNNENKVYLTNEFAIKLMFCLTHFIDDGCPDKKGGAGVTAQKFKRRYEYRELFVRFVKEYAAKNDNISNIKKLLKEIDTPAASDSDKQKVFMKYLLLLIAFESNMLDTLSKSFLIPDPSTKPNEFIDMLKRIMNCFSIKSDIIKNFYENELMIQSQESNENELMNQSQESNETVSSWLKKHLLSTIEFYFYFSEIPKENIENYLNDNTYFKTLKTEMNNSKIKEYLSDYVNENNEIKDATMFFLEYITGKKEKELYFYNYSLPIIPYNSS